MFNNNNKSNYKGIARFNRGDCSAVRVDGPTTRLIVL